MTEKSIIRRISNLLEFEEHKILKSKNIAEKLACQCYINAYKICISIIKDELTRGVK